MVIVAIAAVGVAVLLWRWWAGRPSRAATGQNSAVAPATSEIPIEPEPEPDTPALRTGIELALQVLDEQREPADAIVRAWLGLQETAEESGIVRRPAETPTEFTSRILSRAFADDRAVRTLLRLYLRTRFGDHPVTSRRRGGRAGGAAGTGPDLARARAPGRTRDGRREHPTRRRCRCVASSGERRYGPDRGASWWPRSAGTSARTSGTRSCSAASSPRSA